MLWRTLGLFAVLYGFDWIGTIRLTADAFGRARIHGSSTVGSAHPPTASLFGLLSLLSFSLELALVLTSIGVLVLYAKNLLPESTRTGDHPFFRWVSIASPAVVMALGLMMTAASLGWLQTKWLTG